VAASVARAIGERTWGRVRRLDVEMARGRVIVHGCAASYYVKQLAIQATLEALGHDDGTRVTVDIDVSPDTPRPT
jgi:hypothetical protein